MAFSQGTTTGAANLAHLDMLDRMVTFLTGLLAPETWVVRANTTSGFTVDGEVYLEAPGLGGTDEIFINIKTFSDIATSKFGWILNGAVSFNGGLDLTKPELQAGAILPSQTFPRILFGSGNFDYTLVGNGRRVVLTCNPQGTIFESCYLGFLDPYSSPTEYPFPLFIGGCHSRDEAISDIDNDHCWFLHDLTNDSDSAAYIRLTNGVWARSNTKDLDSDLDLMFVYPGTWLDPNHEVVTTEDGKYVKYNARIVSNQSGGVGNPQAQLLGELDGVFWVTNFGLNPKDILQFGGDDFEVFQNTFRSGPRDFACVKLV